MQPQPSLFSRLPGPVPDRSRVQAVTLAVTLARVAAVTLENAPHRQFGQLPLGANPTGRAFDGDEVGEVCVAGIFRSKVTVARANPAAARPGDSALAGSDG